MSIATATTSRRDTQASSMKPHVLIVEDETALVELLRYNLEQSGFRVAVAYDGEEALASVQDDVPDLILLDWMLPLMSGIEVCRQLRRQTSTANVPIIMLTARGEEGDRVRGLDAGADDYVSKPFSPTELVARIRAVLRRIRPALADEALSYADIVMDLVAHRVTRAGKPIHLGPTEFRLLRHFMEHPGRVFSREQLLDAVWGKDVYVEARTVDVHIRRLRMALNGEQQCRRDPHRPRRRLRARRHAGLIPFRPGQESAFLLLPRLRVVAMAASGHSDQVPRLTRRRGSIEATIHLRPVQRFEDGVEYRLGSGEHVAIPESQDSIAAPPQKCVTFRIIGRLRDVLTAIELDDDRGFQADEVADVGTDRTLSSELEAIELAKS